jgi:hypothetical protein
MCHHLSHAWMGPFEIAKIRYCLINPDEKILINTSARDKEKIIS